MDTPKPESILFFVPGFPKDEADTQCLPAVQNYIGSFAETHPEVETHVVAFQYPPFSRRYPWRQAHVQALGGNNRGGLARLRTWARAVAASYRLHRRTRILVLHSFWLSECTYLGQWLGKAFKLRHIASIGGQDARAENPYHKVLSYADVTLTAGSAFAVETFVRHTGRPHPHIIPLGIDRDHILQLDRPAVRDIDLLGVGALTPLKNYRLFINLVETLVPAYPNLTAYLIGQGPEEEVLRQLIQAKGLTAHITMTGALPRDEVLRYMLRSRVLVHPSHYESQGYVFLEALQTGLYVVSFDVGHTGDRAKSFRCDTEQEMASKLHTLLQASLSHEPAPVVTTHDTVRSFASLYFAQ